MSDVPKNIEIEFVSVLFCDDVRREINGKEMLIGVYSEAIGVTSYPAQFALTVWVQTRTKVEGEIPVSFRLRNTEGAEFLSRSGRISDAVVDEMGSIHFDVPLIPITGDTTLVAQSKVRDGDWITIGTLDVNRLNEDGTPVSEPNS